jgi:methylmalonyl-CoA epimerase
VSEPFNPLTTPGIIRIHHIGIVVRDAALAADRYQAGFGMEVLAIEEHRNSTRVAILRAGETMLHLIQPVRDDSPWATVLRDRGEGAHHLALEVADLQSAIAALSASGVRFVEPRPKREAGDLLSIFLDAASTGGTRIELVQQIRT